MEEIGVSSLQLGRCPWTGGVGVSALGGLARDSGGLRWVRLGLYERRV